MLRNGMVQAAAALFIAGCAHSDREATAPVRTKVEKVRECTVTINVARICGAPKNCSEIATCSEASYRLKICGHRWLDGDRNGIPCQTMCGRDAKTMGERIASEKPFSPKPETDRVCRPVT